MRALAGVLAVAVAVVGLSLAPVEQAEAAVVQWGTNSGTAPNYQATVNGDFVMAGNGVLACQTLNISGAGTCAELHSTSTNTQNVNDNFAMVATNTVSGFTTNSSSAQVTIPAGASVAKAFLSWSANTGSYNVSQTACTAPSTARGTTTLPGGAANGYLTRAAQLRVGSGTAAPAAVTPASVLVDQPVAGQPQYYSASADVTSAFAGAATGSPLTVSAGNIWTPTGAGCYAGWSLTVVYDYGSYVAGNAASVPKRVIFYEGHVRQASTDTPLTVAFAGFTAVGAGTRAGFTLFEGDRSITGDTVEYSRASSSTYTQLPNANGAVGNYGVGQALGSTRYTQTGTPFTNQSVDVTTNSLIAVQSGDSRIDLRVSTSGDSYLLRNAVLSVPTAGLQVDKSADGTADVQSRLAGEPASFTIRLTNSGAGTLQSISVSDDQADCTRTLTGLTLAPQESYTYTCTANSGSSQQYVSTATATARTVAGAFLAEDSDSTTVQVTALALAKTSALAAGATGRAGDTLTYTFTATNTGQSTLTGVAVADPLPGLSAVSYSWPGAAGTLTAGQAVVATATYVLRQADVDAGSVANTATLVGTDPDGGQQPRASAARTTPLAPAPRLGVTKTGALAAGAAGVVGDRVTWSLSFTNTGNVTLTGVALTDSLAGLSTPVVTWPGAAGTLAPGQTATATATSALTQAQVDAGAVRNTASVTGRTPAGDTTSASSGEAVVATVAAAPSLVTTKSAVVGGAGGVGSTVTYSFSARNSGNVTLTGVSIGDPLPRLSALVPTWPGTAGTLAPGQTVTATATYTLTQADVDAGSVRNTATATGTAPSGAAVSAASPQVVTPTAAAAPAVTLAKSGALAAGATGVAGDTVTYAFVLRNTGNVTLTGASVSDPLPGLSALTYGTWPGATAGTLAPSQQVTASATYTLRQADVDAGAVANAATGTATPPTGAAVSQTRGATVPITPTGTLVVTKTGTASGAAGVGSTVTYDFTVRNSGNVTLTQVSLADARAGVSAPTVTWPGQAGTLAPGQTATARATYTITQADVDAGRVPNTATATGRTPQGATVTGTSPQSVVTTAPAAPAVTLGKAGVVQGGAAGGAGDVVRYTFTLRNSGNVTVTGLAVADPLAGLSALQYAWPATAGTLAPGQTATATASYTLTQADVNAGAVRNTATASGRYGTAPVTATSGEVTTPTAAAQPSAAVTKSGALTNGQAAAAGSTITWSFTLRNTGNVTLTNAGVADSLPGISAVTWGPWPSGAAGTLQPGQTVTGTATSPVTQQDVDAGSVANTATGSGTAPSGAVVRSVAPATVALAAVPGISLGKSGAVTSGTGAVGDTVTYTFSVRNTGNTTLTGVAVADPAPGLSALTYGTWPGGTAGTLAPGQTVTATATHVVTQADLDAGVVRNTATVSARTPGGDTVTATSPQAVVPTAAAAPALATTKTASNGGGGVGSVVSYAFSARNSGNVTLTGVVVTDPLSGLSALAYSWPGTAGTLRPGQTVTATATYTVTQADVDRGSVPNRSTASGTSPSGAAVSVQSAVVTTATAASSPSLALTKSGVLSGPPAAGSTITYSFSLRNTGNVTLTGAALADPMPGLSPLVVTWPGAPGVLGPDQRAAATATRTVTQADVDAGAVANTASASAAPPTGGRVSSAASATVPLPASGALAVEKTGVVTSGTGVAGDVVRFDFVVRNTGAVTVSGIVLADALPGVGTPTITWPGAARTLAPGQQATATATYVVRQSDVDSGSVRNTASVQGTTPAGTTVSAASLPAVVPTAAAAPALDVQKSASSPGDRKVGDVVTYAVSVQNTGNQTVTGVTIVDSLPGLSAPSVTWPGQAGVLAPGQQALATATYVVRQVDVDAGQVVNEASASGRAPGGVAVVDSSGPVATTTQAAAPSLAVTKAGAFASGSSGRAGDVVDFAVTLRNTGNQTLTGVTATDSLPGLGALAYGTWPSGTAGTLAPGQTVTATASYTSRQSDLDAGAIANTAEGRATAPGGAGVAASGSASVPTAQTPALSLVEVGTASGRAAVGDTATFTYTARNTGNQTLTGVVVAPGAGLSTQSATWSGTPGTLAPGQTVTLVASRTVTQADVDAGSVRDAGSATGTAGARTVTATASSSVATVASAPRVTTTKTSSTGGAGAVGDVVTYSFRASNAGNVTLTDVTITDPLTGLSPLVTTWPGATGVLAPGQSLTAVATYTLGQADVDRGSVVNTATTTATAPGGTTVSSSSAVVTTATTTPVPALVLEKTGALAAGSTPRAGSVVDYAFRLVNTGNVTLTGVGVADALPGLGAITVATWPSGTAGTLRPGDSVVGTAAYSVRQADVDAGSVANTAVATATPPVGAPVTTRGSSTVALVAAGAVALTKTAVVGGAGGVGDTVTFSYVVTNTSAVTLAGVGLVDGLAGLGPVSYGAFPGGAAGVLAPGESVTAGAVYTIRQADVDAGVVASTATATGRTPQGTVVSADAGTRSPTVAAAPGLTTTKSVTPAGGVRLGDTVRYAVTASNTGNVTLTGVVLADPLPGLSTLTPGAWPDGVAGRLLPGQSVSATANYTIRQSDVDRGSVTNTATSTGTTPAGAAVSAPSAALTSPTAAAAPSLAVTQTGSLAAGAVGRAGDVVTWSSTVSNSGDQTVSGITVGFDQPGTSAPVVRWPGAVGVLAPGQTATATATSTLTQADVDSGSVSDVATARGTSPAGTAVEASAPATVPIGSDARITLEKVGRIAPGAAGEESDPLQYVFTVRNAGNVTLTGVALVDELPGVTVGGWAWPDSARPGVLSPGAVATALGDYTVTQADVDAEAVTNRAAVRATSPGGQVVEDEATVVVQTGAQRADLVTTKSAVVEGDGGVGDDVVYSFTAENTGNVTLTGVEVVDGLPGLSQVEYVRWPGAPNVLAPGGTVAATATYTITQADVDRGSVANTATSVGTSPVGVTVTSASVAVETPTVRRAAAVSVDKSAALAGDPAAGSVVTYSFTVRNTGNTTLYAPSVADALPGLSPIDVGALPAVLRPALLDPETGDVVRPADSATVTATYALQQADLDAGAVANTATATAVSRPTPGAPVDQSVVVASSDAATVPLAAEPLLTLDKRATLPSGVAAARVGDVVTYSFTAVNTGNVTLDGVAISDPLAGLSELTTTWPGDPGVLAPRGTVSATATYTVTQSDVDRGAVRNQATVVGAAPDGDDLLVLSPQTVVPTVASAPQLATAIQSTVGGRGQVGDVVQYVVTVTNVGNVTVEGVALDARVTGGGALAPLAYGTFPSGTARALAPGQSVTVRTSHVLTQADLDAGRVELTGVATGTAAVSGAPVTSAPAVRLDDTAVAAPSLAVTDEGALASGATGVAGDAVTWRYSVTNTGTVTITDLELRDALPVDGLAVTWPGTAGQLAPGQTATGTSTHRLTQDEVDAGGVTSRATASGTSPAGAAVTGAASAVVEVLARGALAVVKTGALADGAAGGVGDTVVYRLEITNTGNVTLDQGVLVDPLPGLGTPTITWPSPERPGYVPVGATVVGVAEYPLTQADVDRGYLDNTAAVRATTPAGAAVDAPSNTVRVATALPAPALTTTKVATTVDGDAPGVGDVVTYRITTRNTGTVTLTGVALSDSMPGLSPIVTDSWPGSTGVLAPGAQVSGTATYTVGLADVDAGSVVNTAGASGVAPGGAGVESVPAVVATPTEEASPEIVVSDAALPLPGYRGVAGDQVQLTYTLVNRGNVTLSSVAFVDALAAASSPTYVFPNADGATVRPGQSVVATATVVLTQADVDAGALTSLVTGSATSPRGVVLSQTAPATFPIASAPGLYIDKLTVERGKAFALGESIDYTITVTNTGTVTLSGVLIYDALDGLSRPVVTWPGQERVLAPGESARATASYVVRQSDVDRGTVTNLASASAQTPTGASVPTVSDEVVNRTVAAAPAVTTTSAATVGGTGAGAVGDTVTFSVLVRNTGNVTLTGVTTAAPLPGLSAPATTWPGDVGVLAPGQVVETRATYVLTQADVDRGSVVLDATGSGTAPDGRVVDAPAPLLSVPTAAAAPAALVTDSGSLAPGATGLAGDELVFTYTLVNTGNTTLTAVGLTDRTAGVGAPAYAWPGAEGVLAPGQTVTATARYTLTQADVDAGSVTSVVVGTSTDPAGVPRTASAPATVVVAPAPALTVVKSAEIVSGTGGAGDVVRYRLDITNTGSVTLTDGRLLDPLPGLGTPQITWPDPDRPGRVGVGETVVGVADYALTQADVDLGHIDNQASVSALTPQGVEVIAESNTVRVVTVEPSPSLTVTQTGAVRAEGGAGDTVDWVVVVRNTGNVTLQGVQPTGTLAGLPAYVVEWPGAPGVLAPGAVATARASSPVEQSDVDAGSVTNVAAASGVSVRDGAAVVSPDAPTTVPTLAAAPGLSVTKTADLADGARGVAGDTVSFAYTATNTGTVTLTGVELVDAQGGATAPTWAWPGAAGVLAPGQSATATAGYTLTQSDVDSGAQSSTVTATGRTPSASTVEATATDDVVLAAEASMIVAKSGAARGPGGVGDVVDYTFSITNTGDVTLSLVDLVDQLGGVSEPQITWPGEPGTLAPEQVATATATYVVTQADVDRGSVGNTALATGKPPVGDTISVSSPLTTTTVQPAAPGLTVTKTGAPRADGALRDTVDWSFVVTNTGNVTVTGIALVDDVPGVSTPAVRWPGDEGVLAPGQRATATATSEIGQADLDRGEVVNVASATGSFAGVAVTATTGEASAPTAAPAPAIAVTDSGALAAGSTGVAGDSVTWSYRVTNTGTVTLAGVALAERVPGTTAPVVAWPGEPGVLAPGASATATTTAVLTQADVDAGAVSSTVDTTGTDRAGTVVAARASATVPIVPAGALVVTQVGGVVAPGIGQVGDTVEYAVTVRNDGNVTLSDVGVALSLAGLSAGAIDWPAAPGVLEPGRSVLVRATLTLTQADVDRGFVENTASTRGTAPGGVEVTAVAEAVRVATVSAVPGITTTKSGSVSGAGALGDLATFEIVVRNTGNVTLTGVSVADDLEGLSPLAYGPWPGAAGVLAPGQAVTATTTIVLDQSDVDAGGLVNTATATGTPPGGAAPVSDASDPAPVAAEAARPAVAVTDAGALAPGSTGVAGDTVVWTQTIRNTGTVTLTGAALVDALPGIGAPVYVWPGEPGVLLPGQVATATSTSVLLQADVDAGSVASQVTGSALPPTGAAATATDVATVPIASAPGLTLVKEAALASAGQDGLGDLVDYTFTIGNTGNVTLTGVVLADPLPGLGPVVVTWPSGQEGVLQPGTQATATARYAIQQEDVDRGAVQNSATATATAPDGRTSVAASTLVVVPTEASAPSIATEKSGVVAGSGAVGDVVTYTFRIVNTGNVTLNLIALRDRLPGLSRPDIDFPTATGILAPGESALGEATYAISQADVDRGHVDNQATSVGSAPDGTVVTGVSNTVRTSTDPRAASLTTTQTAGLAPGDVGRVGDLVEYTFTVVADGPRTVTDVRVDSTVALTDVVAVWPGQPGTLAPGQQLTVTARHVVTQADVDAGRVVNVVTGSGRDAAGEPVADDADEAVVELVAASRALDLQKTGTRSGSGAVGDAVEYRFVVENTGETTVRDVVVVDPLPGLSALAWGAWPAEAGVLAPGESATATATYVLTQADVDRGSVRNTATVSGTTPRGDDVADASDESVVPTAPRAASLDVTKQQALAVGAEGRPGDVVEYSYSVTNTGNVTLDGVSLRDPQPRLSRLSYRWPGEPGVLMPGQTATATATYVLTQADVEAGVVASVVTASASTPADAVVIDRAADSVAIVAISELALSKVAQPRTSAQLGADVDYRFEVTNTGTATLTGVVVEDDLVGLTSLVYRWPGAPGVLAPGEVVVATASYVVDQADVEAGAVANTATARASGADGASALATDGATVTVVPSTAPQPPVDPQPPITDPQPPVGPVSPADPAQPAVPAGPSALVPVSSPVATAVLAWTGSGLAGLPVGGLLLLLGALVMRWGQRRPPRKERT